MHPKVIRARSTEGELGVFLLVFFFMGSIAEIRFICIMIEPNDSSERNSVNRMKKNGPKFAFW